MTSVGITQRFAFTDDIVFELQTIPAATQHNLNEVAEFCSVIAINTITEPTPDDALQIEIGHQIIQHIPLSLLERVSGTTLFRIPPNRFFPEIPLIALQRSRVYVRLLSGTHFRIYIVGRNVESQLRRQEITETPIKHIFQQITLHKLLTDTPTTRFEAIIGFIGHSRGYILECPAIHTLRRFQLSVNRRMRLNYGPEELLLATTQLSPTLLWIPFNPGTPAFPAFPLTQTDVDEQYQHFDGSFPQRRCDNLQFTFEFSETQSHLNIYCLSHNELQIRDGFVRTMITNSYIALAGLSPSPASPTTDETTTGDA